MIHLVKNQDIDKERWNNIVENSKFSDVYAFSWYLDIVCPNWEGLILNDYEAVFPLPIKKKFCFKYLVQPTLSQRYSIYSLREISKEEKNLFFTEIVRYKRVRICITEQFSQKYTYRQNFILDLSPSYEDLHNNYSENTRRNIQKSQIENIQCTLLTNKSEALQKLLKIDESNIYKPYQTQIEQLIQHDSFEAYEITYVGECYAIAFFAKTKTKIYYLFPASSAKGKLHSAMFQLVDTVIQKHAGTNLILDFEGSEIEGVKRFYEGFGSKSEKYYFIDRKFSF